MEYLKNKVLFYLRAFEFGERKSRKRILPMQITKRNNLYSEQMH